ncbi:MAG TPA: adenosylcobalamin-dependent ribonucleoside-diphosphate reductase [Candidatus Nanoarchaeia archaeon]|nr:adenosylcobalamin-dependent ribonucleoside-diphosphate reductase [Candidatus Nanoarchaeia archaeon]
MGDPKMKLSSNALKVLRERYLLKDRNRRIIETPDHLFRRVANAITKNKKQAKEFYGVMSRLEFVPNTPTLMNAGTDIGQLSACFVLPVEDSLESIYTTLKNSALIHQSGGGTGFDFSRLRPEGDTVFSTKGTSSGPVSFISIFDKSTDVIKQGGKRRGANQGILRIDHPDIVEFIKIKSTNPSSFRNFNLTVAITDRFMKAVKANRNYDLINPRNRKTVKRVNAKKIFNLIVDSAWRCGDPCLIFIDEINRRNPTPALGRLEATNPCAELPLLPYESCNLGAINLSKVVENKEIDWEKLRRLVQTGVTFLDNVVDKNKYPLKEIRDITLANRKIGLGVMGFADMLVLLGIPYNTEEAVSLGEKIMKFIKTESKNQSAKLAGKYRNFPNFRKSIWARKYRKMRNATTNCLQPTGTVSIIAGCSSSIEPIFGIAFVRHVLAGKNLVDVNPLFRKTARERGFYTKNLIYRIVRRGTIQGIKEIPEDVRKVFVCAHDIKPEWHITMQAAFQKHIDNAVSKTVNLHHNASRKDVEKAFLLAYRLKCKGITVYRDRSKKEQVLSLGVKECPKGICPV